MLFWNDFFSFKSICKLKSQFDQSVQNLHHFTYEKNDLICLSCKFDIYEKQGWWNSTYGFSVDLLCCPLMRRWTWGCLCCCGCCGCCFLPSRNVNKREVCRLPIAIIASNANDKQQIPHQPWLGTAAAAAAPAKVVMGYEGHIPQQDNYQCITLSLSVSIYLSLLSLSSLSLSLYLSVFYSLTLTHTHIRNSFLFKHLQTRAAVTYVHFSMSISSKLYWF